jgi:hypothetical protein
MVTRGNPMPKAQKDKAPKKEKRTFSGFTLKEAMQLLGIEELRPGSSNRPHVHPAHSS